MSEFELNILTNGGYVVTLISDRAIDLGDAVLTSIIVQPKEEHEERIAETPDVPRKVYRLKRLADGQVGC